MLLQEIKLIILLVQIKPQTLHQAILLRIKLLAIIHIIKLPQIQPKM